ncbi:hypothetical protein [Terrisporobacter sp.]|uniref:hypothetical protein n=1 Tax=Terrisporobacter sp. TaxID=1965305 RepID=UPI002620B418|nr:hypothetical protein [Terrisporobacter sp.]
MKKMNKVFYIIATILQVLLLVGIYVVNYFTRKKMGMLRYVIYKNGIFEEAYPIQQLQYISILVFIILMILTLVFYIKKKSKLNRSILNMNIVMVILTSIYTGFTLLYSTEDFRAFYFMSLMLGLATFIQIIKTFLSVFVGEIKVNE